MSDFLCDLAAARASGELKGTVSSSKVISGLEMSNRSGLEVVVLMSVGIVAGGESLLIQFIIRILHLHGLHGTLH